MAEESIEDVGLDDEPSYPGRRTDLKCGECGSPMVLRPFSNFGPFYGCTRWPDCDGRHGAHPDGSPKGVPADKITRQARIRAHRVFDALWKKKLVPTRGQAYAWMRGALKLSHSKAHIANFTEAQCDELIRLVKRDFPQLKTRYDAILFDDFVDEPE